MLLAVLAIILSAGCAEPEPTSIEVYAEPPTSQPDGFKESTGVCGDTARLETHVQLLAGAAEVRVTDGAGVVRQWLYGASDAFEGTVEGEEGTWTLRVEWTGFRGSVHAGLLC